MYNHCTSLILLVAAYDTTWLKGLILKLKREINFIKLTIYKKRIANQLIIQSYETTEKKN